MKLHAFPISKLLASRTLREAVVILVTALLTLVAMAYVNYGSIPRALAALNGRGLASDPITKDLGCVEPGAKVPVEFKISNILRRPVKLLGVESSCYCIVPDIQLPRSLGPGESIIIPISVASSTEQRGEFRQMVRLHTNLPRQPHLVLEVKGNIRDDRPTSTSE